MASFFKGQRIKKVRGFLNIGATGVIESFEDDGMAVIRTDQLTVNLHTLQYRPAGSLGCVLLVEWEPIRPLPTCEQIRTMTGLQEWNCPLPAYVGAA